MQEASVSTRFTRPEAGVVVVVVDVQDLGLAALQEARPACGRCFRSRGRPGSGRRRRPAARGRPPPGAGSGTRPASGNSFAARNITESLPSCASMWCSASSEPSASPSGPSWVVSRKRSPARSSSATSVERTRRCARRLAATASLTRRAAWQTRTPRSRRLVVVEAQGRGALDPHLAGDRRLEHAVRGGEPRERRLALGLVAEHADVDARRAQVRACLHGGHGHESDPWVLELGRDRRPDHLRA